MTPKKSSWLIFNLIFTYSRKKMSLLYRTIQKQEIMEDDIRGDTLIEVETKMKDLTSSLMI